MTGRGDDSNGSQSRAKSTKQSGKSSSGKGSGTSSSCDLSFQTILASPNPSIVAKLSASSVLDVAIEKATLRGKQVQALVAKLGKEVAGTIDDVQSTDLIACIGKGFRYKATVLRVTGGEVLVGITKK